MDIKWLPLPPSFITFFCAEGGEERENTQSQHKKKGGDSFASFTHSSIFMNLEMKGHILFEKKLYFIDRVNIRCGRWSLDI